MFKPTKKNSFKETIKDYLLKGYVLRYDSQGENPLEVLSRDCVKGLSTMGNIGNPKGYLVKNLFCAHSNLYEVMDELEAEYSVNKVSCTHSGCCQYATYGVYLDGE